jgi:hypothetical protein
MATPFENFVNGELPKRVSIEVPSSGNLDPDKYLVSTGVGLGVKLVNAPGGGVVLPTRTAEQFMVTAALEYSFTLSNMPLANSETIFFNGLPLVNYMGADYGITGKVVTISNEHTVTEGDVFTVKYEF